MMKHEHIRRTNSLSKTYLQFEVQVPKISKYRRHVLEFRVIWLGRVECKKYDAYVEES